MACLFNKHAVCYLKQYTVDRNVSHKDFWECLKDQLSTDVDYTQ